MKNYRMLVPIALILLMVLSVYMLGKENKKTEDLYQNHLAKARDYAEQKIYDYAKESYLKALEIKPSAEVYIEAGVCNYDPSVKIEGSIDDNFDMYSAIVWAEDIVNRYPKNSNAYKYLIELNYISGNYAECFSLYNVMIKKRLKLDDVNEIISNIEYKYEFIGDEYDEVKEYINKRCVVAKGDRWGYLDEIGNTFIELQFLKASDYLSDIAVVYDENNNISFWDREGKKCKNISQDIKSKDIGPVGDDNLFVVNNDEKYAYYSYETMEKVFGDYDEATTMFHGRAAVKEKDKWYLINTKAEKLNDTSYDGFFVSYQDIICIHDRIFAKKGDKYILLDKDGVEIGADTYEDVDIFWDGSYAAVKQNGKWGYIDLDGNKVIDCQYEEAKSFSNGIGAVKQNGKWGYINTDNKIVIELQFDEAKYLNSKGHAFVYSNGQWTLLSLYKYNH